MVEKIIFLDVAGVALSRGVIQCGLPYVLTAGSSRDFGWYSNGLCILQILHQIAKLSHQLVPLRAIGASSGYDTEDLGSVIFSPFRSSLVFISLPKAQGEATRRDFATKDRLKICGMDN
jgi:hypothetical protein